MGTIEMDSDAVSGSRRGKGFRFPPKFWAVVKSFCRKNAKVAAKKSQFWENLEAT